MEIRPTPGLKPLLGPLLGVWGLGLWGLLPMPIAQAQSITAAGDGTGTVVAPPLGGVYEITGGSLSGDGDNLFHSFDRFTVAELETANFATAPGITTILGRVVGGQASYIDGLVQVTGGQANLVLINPAGLLTGLNGRIEVSGRSFTGTTAAELGFPGAEFEVLGTTDFSLLNGEPRVFRLAADGGAIVNEGRISASERLQLVGSTVLNTGTLSATEMVLVSAGGAQTVNLDGTDGIALGTNSLGNALLTVPSLGELLQQRVAVPVASTLSVDGDGTVRLEGEAIALAPGSLLSSSSIGAGNLVVVARDNVTAQDDLNANNRLELRALGGDAIVSVLQAGQGGIRVFAGGQFQARGANVLPDDNLELTVRAQDVPEIQAFLNSKGIVTAPDDAVTVVFNNSPDGTGTGTAFYSLQTRPTPEGLATGELNAPIFIEFGGASRTLVDQTFTIPGAGSGFDFPDDIPIDTTGRILIRGGEGPFFSGPAVVGRLVPGSDDPYVTVDATNQFVAVSAASYSLGDKLFANAVYDTGFPNASFGQDSGSGINAGILIGFGTNQSLYGFVQDRAFEALPTGGGGPVVTNPPAGGGTSGGGTGGGTSGGSTGGGRNPNGPPGSTVATRGIAVEDVTRPADGGSPAEADLAQCEAQSENAADEPEADTLTESREACPGDRDSSPLLGNIVSPALPPELQWPEFAGEAGRDDANGRGNGGDRPEEPQ